MKSKFQKRESNIFILTSASSNNVVNSIKNLVNKTLEVSAPTFEEQKDLLLKLHGSPVTDSVINKDNLRDTFVRYELYCNREES